jgi:disulfide bond formation protein DsbB
VINVLELIKRFTAPRWLFLDLFLYCLMMMLVAMIYFQHYLSLDPCPLCVMQRVFVISTAVIVMLAFLHNPGVPGRKVYSVLAMLPTLAGIATSLRHVWLQSLPKDKLPECGPGLDYLMNVFSYVEALQKVFLGSGECGDVLWSFLGLTIPGWTLVAFLVLLAGECYQLFRKN